MTKMKQAKIGEVVSDPFDTRWMLKWNGHKWVKVRPMTSKEIKSFNNFFKKTK